MARVWLGLLALLSLGTFAVCYTPDLSGVHYTCDQTNPYCPDGQICVNGTCAFPGDTPASDLGNLGNLGDGGNPDGSPAASGCKAGGGTELGGDVWACPGKFSTVRGQDVPHADQLCASGYGLCTQAGSVDLVKCKALTGFFAAKGDAKGDKGTMAPDAIACDPPKNGNDSHFYPGCGTSAQATVIDITHPCDGFSQVVECHFGGVWGCLSYTPLDQADNTVATDGVLCCRL